MTNKKYQYIIGLFIILASISSNVKAADNIPVINLKQLDIIGESLDLTKASLLNIPAMETKLNFIKSKSFLSNDLYSSVIRIPQLQIDGGPRRLAQSFTMRGFDKNGISILIDDIPIAFLSEHMNSIFLPQAAIQSIDVIRGPFSALYGSNAVGGVVSFKTLDVKDLLTGNKKQGAMLGAQYTTVDKGLNYFVNGYGISNNGDTFFINLSDMTTNNIRSGDNNRMPIYQKDSYLGGVVKFNFNLPNNQDLKFNYYFNQVDSLVPSNPGEGAKIDNMIDNINHHVFIGSHVVRLEHDYNSTTNIPNLKTVMYYNYTKQDEIAAADFPDGSWYKKGDDLGKTNNTFGLKHLENMNFYINDSIDTSLVYGLDYEGQTQRRNEEDPRGLVATANSNNVGGFVKNDWSITKYFNVSSALRYDYININQGESSNKNYSQLSPKASITVKPVEPLMMYVSYGRGFRTPNLNEMYASGQHFYLPVINMGPMGIFSMENDLIPNPDLKPAISDTVEAGYALHFDKLPLNGTFKLKNAFYYTRAKNYITLFVSAPSINMQNSTLNSTSEYVNIPHAKLEGIDANASYETPIFEVIASYNFLKGINTDSGSSLMNISNHTADLTYIQKVYKGLSVGYNLRAQSGFDSCTVGSTGVGNYACGKKTEYPGFLTHDVFVNYSYSKYTFSVGVDNLADKFYYNTFAAVPASGRNYKFMFTMKL